VSEEARTITWVAVGALRSAVRQNGAQLGVGKDQLLDLLKKIQEGVREPGPEIPRLTVLASGVAVAAREHSSLQMAMELFTAAMLRWGIVLRN
jgi:hypothetical protein